MAITYIPHVSDLDIKYIGEVDIDIHFPVYLGMCWYECSSRCPLFNIAFDVTFRRESQILT